MHRSAAEGRFGEAEPVGRASVCARALLIGVCVSAEGRYNHHEWSHLIVVEKREAVKRGCARAEGVGSGSFKVYAEVKGKLKATTVNVTGLMVGNVGYDTATVKKLGSVPVTVEE